MSAVAEIPVAPPCQLQRAVRASAFFRAGPFQAAALRRGHRAAGGRGGRRGGAQPAAGLQGAVLQSERQGWRRHRGPVVHDECPLQVFGGRGRHPGAGRARARRPPAPGHPGPAQGLGDRVRAHGDQPLRRDAIPGAPELPARARGRTDALHPGAVVRAERTRPSGAAQPERIFPRTAEAFRFRAAEPVPRPLPRSHPTGRHRASGGFQRARDVAFRRQRARRYRQAAVAIARYGRRQRHRCPAAVLRAADRAAIHPPHPGHPGARGRQEQRQGPGDGRGGFLAIGADVRAAPSQPDARQQCSAQPAGGGKLRRHPGQPAPGRRSGRRQQPAAPAVHRPHQRRQSRAHGRQRPAGPGGRVQA